MLIAVFFPLDSLLAGIPQKVKFTVTTGHYTVKNGDSLQLSNVDAMLILCPEENRAVIYSNTRGKGHSRVKAGLWPWCTPSGSKALSSAASSGGIQAPVSLQLSAGSVLPVGGQ